MISSPCIKLCVIDPALGLCQGCGRSLDEIAAWGSMEEVRRLALMAMLPARLEAAALRRHKDGLNPPSPEPPFL